MDADNLQLSDEQLCRLVQDGALDAFEELVLRYKDRLLRYGRKFLLDESQAEDAVQEVFLKAYRNIQSFNLSLRFSPWIYRIAHNEFINLGKKRSKELVDFFDFDTLFPHPAAADKADTELEKKEARQLLEAYLDKLPDKYREPLILYYMEDLDYGQISEILKIPLATVGVRLNRARKKLQQFYKEQEKI